MRARAAKITMVLLVPLLALIAGCRSIGPSSVTRDRFDYSGALAESWKDQMLLNLVKTRYLDLPIYLDVGQIVSGYTLQTSGNLGGTVSETKALGGNTASIGVGAIYTDRPTITYTPLTGDAFLEGFLSPVDPAKIFSLVQAGYAADFILKLSLDSLNGLRNDPVSLQTKRKADPEFFRVLSLMRDIQDAGAVGLRVQRTADGQPATVLFFRGEDIDPSILDEIKEVQKLLGVAPGESSFHLVQSPLRGGAGELAVGTRSLYQILGALSAGVEIPEPHVARELAPPMPAPTAGEHALVHVHSGPEEPKDAFVAVPYEGEWFWIANNDWESKRSFSSILFLFTIANPGRNNSAPVLTIPTQ